MVYNMDMVIWNEETEDEMKDKHIEGNIYLIYSPDESLYYFDDRTPGSWGESCEVYDTAAQAISAYDDGWVKFTRE